MKFSLGFWHCIYHSVTHILVRCLVLLSVAPVLALNTSDKNAFRQNKVIGIIMAAL